MKKLITSFTFLFIVLIGKAQSDTVYTLKYLTKSTTFAATTIGADFLVVGAGKSTFTNNGNTQSVDFSPTAIPRLSIGGIHFWGHTEFYVNFPLPFLAINKKPAAFDVLKHTHGIDASLKLYPIALKTGGIRPYAGIGFRLLSFQQQLKGEQYRYDAPSFQKTIYPV